MCFFTQIFWHFGQFCFYSRQVCDKGLASWTATTNTLTLNGLTRNAKRGLNSWKWPNLAWNSSSSLTIYFSILPLCGLHLRFRETPWFSFQHWETDRMFLTCASLKNFNFLLGRKLAQFRERRKSSLTCDLGSLSLLLLRSAYAQSFAPRLQATIEIMRRNLSSRRLVIVFNRWHVNIGRASTSQSLFSNATPPERLQQHPLLFTTNRTNRKFFVWRLNSPWPSHPGHSTILLRSEIPSSICAKLRQSFHVAISLTIACSRYIYNGVILRAHPVRGESQNERNTTGEVATLSNRADSLLTSVPSKVRRTTRAFAQWNLILAHLQHSRFDIAYISRNPVETFHWLRVYSTWLWNCMRTDTNICSM